MFEALHKLRCRVRRDWSGINWLGIAVSTIIALFMALVLGRCEKNAMFNHVENVAEDTLRKELIIKRYVPDLVHQETALNILNEKDRAKRRSLYEDFAKRKDVSVRACGGMTSLFYHERRSLTNVIQSIADRVRCVVLRFRPPRPAGDVAQ